MFGHMHEVLNIETQLENNLWDKFLSLISLWLDTYCYSYKYATVLIKLYSLQLNMPKDDQLLAYFQPICNLFQLICNIFSVHFIESQLAHTIFYDPFTIICFRFTPI